MDNSKPTQRPDLFSAPQAGNRDSRRILASLANSGKSNTPADTLARLRPSHLVAGLSLLAVLAAAVACFSYVGIAPAQHTPEFAISRGQAPLAAAPQEAERLAAAIVNEPLPAIAPATRKQAVREAVQEAAPAAAGRVAAVRAATGPTAAGRAAAGPAAAVAEAARAGAAPGDPWTREPAHARPLPPASAIDSARPRATAYPAVAAPPTRFPATAQSDSDVALLAALVAHTEGQASAAPAMHASRDVVERKEGDSTEALLRRCQRLGGAEAGLCRARICNGLWLHEAACHAPLSD